MSIAELFYARQSRRMRQIPRLVRGFDADVIVLDAQADGVAQITEALRDRTDADAIHVLSHGGPGRELLGDAQLDARTLETYAGLLWSWSDALSATADILWQRGGERGEEVGICCDRPCHR